MGVAGVNRYSSEPLKLYGNPPLCCIVPCTKPKMPRPVDIRKLKIGVFQFCAIQPFLTFVELFLSIEAFYHVGFAKDFGWRFPYMTLAQVLSNFVAMSSCTGLARLCEMVNRTDNVHEGSLTGKRAFVQSFLWGMHLIPTIMSGLLAYCLHDVTLHNGVKMEPKDQSLWAVSAVVCIASIYMTRAAFRAFSTDDPSLYPEDLKEPFVAGEHIANPQVPQQLQPQVMQQQP